jgi:hypothetical protein
MINGDTVITLHSIFNAIAPKTYKHIIEVHNDQPLLFQAIIEFQEALVDNINPKKLWNEIVYIFKKYGVYIGIVVTIIEILDHFCLPVAFAYCGYTKLAVLFTALPVSEIFIYPVIIGIIAKIRREKK